MADRIITFFDRQELSGKLLTTADFYSPIFEVQGASKVVVEAQVYQSDPGAISYICDLQETDDPKFGDSSWTLLDRAIITTVGGAGRSKGAISNPGRFVRVKFSIPSTGGSSAAYLTLGCRGIARV